MWFYQDMEEPDPTPVAEPSKPRMLQPGTSKSSMAPPPTKQVIKKKKLFLTDGWDVPLIGICVYIFRTSTNKQLPEEGFHKVLL